MNKDRSPLAHPQDNEHTQPVHSNSYGSDQMASLVNETLQQYPAHYQASLGILRGVTAGQRGWQCCGAMETALTENGMEVTFDYRRTGASWRRYLIIITMNNGEVTYRDFKELRAGEHSGIRAFEGNALH